MRSLRTAACLNPVDMEHQYRGFIPNERCVVR